MKGRLSILKWGKLLKRLSKFLQDKDVPKFKKILLILPLIYTISPIDLVSDFFPVVGWLDDAAILTVAWNFFLEELKSYEQESGTIDDESQSNKEADYTLNQDDYEVD